ncbi:hypothetical protein MUK42_10376 [Musa troglodytarum]|uniref:Uncharacterized protein n=1 Tax=Musa troglodytarum TaxID=320322 RepID=A0A9E7K752_9LILI|nr:hypothetical protein MUK42_10376 [Musa troglodytarum]
MNSSPHSTPTQVAFPSHDGTRTRRHSTVLSHMRWASLRGPTNSSIQSFPSSGVVRSVTEAEHLHWWQPPWSRMQTTNQDVLFVQRGFRGDLSSSLSFKLVKDCSEAKKDPPSLCQDCNLVQEEEGHVANQFRIQKEKRLQTDEMASLFPGPFVVSMHLDQVQTKQKGTSKSPSSITETFGRVLPDPTAKKWNPYWCDPNPLRLPFL